VSVGGIARSGERLQAAVSGFTGQDPSLALTWQRCGATGACRSLPAHEDSYVLGRGDVGRRLRVRAAATDGGGTAVAYSAQTDVVAPAPAAPPGRVPNGRRADAHARVSAWLLDARGRRSTRAAVRPGASVRVRGSVLDAAGHPIAGATLTLVLGTAAAGPVRTHADGRFAASLRVRAAATLHVAYLPFSDSRRPLRSHGLRVTLRR
jgi:hypothetical protein